MPASFSSFHCTPALFFSSSSSVLHLSILSCLVFLILAPATFRIRRLDFYAGKTHCTDKSLWEFMCAHVTLLFRNVCGLARFFDAFEESLPKAAFNLSINCKIKKCICYVKTGFLAAISLFLLLYLFFIFLLFMVFSSLIIISVENS